MHLGYFPDWTNGPAILFATNDFIELRKLQTIFKSIGAGDNISAAFHNLDFIQSHDNIRFTGILTKAGCGTRMTKDNKSLEWLGTSDWWKTFTELLEPFSELKPGHQYLSDNSRGHAIVIVSYREIYNDEWWMNSK